MDAIALFQNGVPIRLPGERWAHIVKRHEDLNNKQPEVLATVSNSVCILSGDEGELLTLRKLEPGKWLVVVYRELLYNSCVFINVDYVAVRRIEKDVHIGLNHYLWRIIKKN